MSAPVGTTDERTELEEMTDEVPHCTALHAVGVQLVVGGKIASPSIGEAPIGECGIVAEWWATRSDRPNTIAVCDLFKQQVEALFQGPLAPVTYTVTFVPFG